MLPGWQAVTACRDGMAAAHILWETCSAVQHRGLSDEQRRYGNSIFGVVFVVTSGWGCPMSGLSLPRTPIDGSSFEAEVCICGEVRKHYLMTMTMEASALSGEINNSGYQGLTRIPRIYRKSPPKHHFYVRNFFAKTL